MNEYVIRSWVPEDRPQLIDLWHIAFGDSKEYINLFYDTFAQNCGCVLAEADGKVVSAIYYLFGAELRPYRKNTITAGYTYSLGTLPEYRGRGIGSVVYKAANEAILKSADAACILPAEPGLYAFYERTAGVTPVSHAREAVISREEITGSEPRMAVRFPAERYAGVREQILSGLPHAVLPVEYYEFLEETGTEFFLLENGLAAAENDGKTCRILELLDSEEDYMRSVAGIARWCRADEYIVRTPLFFPGPGQERPFMLALMNQDPAYRIPDDLWWGLGMD